MNRLTVRPPAVAGSFYPAERATLHEALRQSFRGAVVPDDGAPVPKALVVPHAGYVYSGPVAASAYLRLAPARTRIRRVVLLGPSHRVPLTGIAVTGADTFATPLGAVRIDAAGRDLAVATGKVRIDDAPHRFEHSLEVQLPFLQVVLDDFELVPLVVGRTRADDVAEVLHRLWGGPETVVLVSTDLSHYLPDADAREVDRRTADNVVALRPDSIASTDACGAYPLRGLMAELRRRGMSIEELDLRTSADTAGDPSSVVGYGAFAAVDAAVGEGETTDADALSTADGERLLDIAERAILDGLDGRRPTTPARHTLPPALQADHGAFVTLHVDGALNGCIGQIEGREPLGQAVAHLAYASAFEDVRLPVLQRRDLPALEIEVSVLSPLEALTATSREELLAQLRPDVHGLVIDAGGRRALFLPDVWEQLPDPDAFLDQLQRKAGLPSGGWIPGTQAWRFTTDRAARHARA